MRKYFIFATSACLLTACVSPKLTRHYDTAEKTFTECGTTPSSGCDSLTLSVFLANPKADEDAPFISSLSDKAQAQMIRSVAAQMPKDSDAGALINALNNAPSSATNPCEWANTTSIKRRVTLTVLGDFANAADRIDKLQFSFALDPSAESRAAFASWDKFDSVYGSYDLGSAKYTQSRKLTLGKTDTETEKLPADAGSVVKLLSGGYEATNSLEENMKYAIRRLSVGGALTSTTATLVQEGGPYINLLGSSSAVLSLRLTSADDPLPVHVLSFKSGAKTLPDEVGVSRCHARYPKSKDPIQVKVTGSAMKRLVTAHQDTISEGDDTVRFQKQDFAPVAFALVTTAELEAKFFGLAYCTNGDALDQCRQLAIENPETGKADDAILVRTPDDAAKLRQWLNANSSAKIVPDSIGLRRLGLVNSRFHGGGEAASKLTPEIVRALRVTRLAGNVN